MAGVVRTVDFGTVNVVKDGGVVRLVLDRFAAGKVDVLAGMSAENAKALAAALLAVVENDES